MSGERGGQKTQFINTFTKNYVQGLHGMLDGMHSCRILLELCEVPESDCNICLTYLSAIVSVRNTGPIILHALSAQRQFHEVELHV
jgi:hypothetical protein